MFWQWSMDINYGIVQFKGNEISFFFSYMNVTTLISFVEKWEIKKRSERAFAIPVHLWLLSTQPLNVEFSIIE